MRTFGRRPSARGGPGVWAGAAALFLTASLLVLPAAALAGPSAPAGFHTLVSSARSSYDTGRVTAVFPTTVPRVQLYQDANASVSATLEVDQILELAPGGYPHPTAVAAAFPASVSGFNGTASPNATGTVRLAALLQVLPVDAAIWAPSSVLTPTGATLGSARLDLAYSVDANGTASAGVRIAWNVSNWPWVSTGDSLAIEFAFSLVSGRSLLICSGTSPLEMSPTCSTAPVGPAAAAWSSGYSSVEGENGTAPVAALSWGPAANLTAGRSVPYTIGAYSPDPGTAEVILGAPAEGSSSVSGSARFALVTPAVPLPPALLHGDLAIFAGTLVAILGAGAIGALAYQRRDRRLRESL